MGFSFGTLTGSWLYFQWYKQTSAILADEMGLGEHIDDSSNP